MQQGCDDDAFRINILCSGIFLRFVDTHCLPINHQRMICQSAIETIMTSLRSCIGKVIVRIKMLNHCIYTLSSYTAKQTGNLITILLNVLFCKLYAVFVLSHSFYSIFPFISFIHHESGVSPSIFTLSPGATTRFQRSMIVWFIASISTNSGCFANASSESN